MTHKTIIDLKTGEVRLVELTQEEIAELQSRKPPEPSEEELLTAMERKILRELAQERLATMTEEERKDLAKR